ncbi:MAG: glycosyltransferase, partial [Polyangiaceae bacterium]|nr:glycosyltransferase [Polyangiaceae bacterium]
MTKTATAPTVSVVLPTYEERENIGPLIEGVARHVDQLAEIIVVDDDSPDLTWQRVAELQRRYAQLRLIRREGIRGLTTAIQAGIAAATGDVLVWMDCDLSMGPEVIPSLVAEIRRGYDVAVASRYVPGGADVRDVVLHRQLSRVICTVARLVLVPSFHDYTSG